MSVQSREVLVIGAGIAGLTAARDLAIDGYNVAILEARERIGGRIWTSHELGLPADLGASWIHGFEDNPIARLARRHAIAIVRTNISSDPSTVPLDGPLRRGWPPPQQRRDRRDV